MYFNKQTYCICTRREISSEALFWVSSSFSCSRMRHKNLTPMSVHIAEVIPTKEAVVSTSEPVEVVAETVIEFGHGGEVAIKFSTSSEDMEQRALEEALAHAAKGAKSYLDFVAHLSEPNEELVYTAYPARQFPMVFFETHFDASITVSFGGLTIPLDNVYFIVHSWLYPAVSALCGRSVQLRTGVPAEHSTILTCMQAMSLAQSFGEGGGISMN